MDKCRYCLESKSRCQQKVLYKSRRKAETKALSVNVERNWFPGECLIPYRCTTCFYWHTTKARRKEQQGRSEKMRLKWLRTQRRRKKLERELWMERECLEGRPHFDSTDELFEFLYPEPEEIVSDWEDDFFISLDDEDDPE